MEIKINNCSNCPFCVTDVDYETSGNDTILHCNLQTYLGRPYEIIACYDSYELFNHDQCNYCNEYNDENDIRCSNDEELEIFDETKCKCDEIRNKWFEEHEEELNYNPDWCPLNELKNINIEK